MANETEIIKENVLVFNEAIQTFYSKLVIAVLILLIGFIVGRLLGRIIMSILVEFNIDDIIRRKLKTEASISSFIGNLISYIVYFISIFIMLKQLGMDKIAVQVISFLIILLAVISTAFAIKDFIPNLLAGMFIHNKKYFKKGDKIKFKGVKGTVADAGLVETKVITASGQTIFIPNSAFNKDYVVKISKK